MARKVIGPTGSRRRRWLFLCTAAAAIAAAVLIIPSAFAWDSSTQGVENTGVFQLDGNTLPVACTSGDLKTNDWAGLYNASPGGGQATKPCGSQGFSFVADGVGNADATYWSGGGSKDAYDPATGTWMWGPNNVSPDKNDLDNAFAAIYNVPDTNPAATVNPAQILFFGSDRFDTSGDAQQGFQFLQQATCLGGATSSTPGSAACPSSVGSTVPATCDTHAGASNVGLFIDPNTGCPVHHEDGDLLVLVNFNKGGTLGSAGVFEWVPASGSPSPGTPDPGGHYTQVNFGSGTNAADCLSITGQSDFCATSNTTSLSTEPVWPYSAKNAKGNPVTNYLPGAFIEGGVNLASIAGAGSCFPTFIAESRSAAGPGTGLGLTAQLKDLVFGQFQLCSSGLVTTPKDGSGGAIPSGGLSLGGSTPPGTVNATDSALLTLSTPGAWTGTMKFFLCGPLTTGTCDGTTGHKGVQIGTTQNISNVTNPDLTQPIVSSAALLTSAGRYCWRGEFHALTPTGLKDATDSTSTECFTVTPVTPALTTCGDPNHTSPTSACNPETVSFGQAVHDTADLSGTATEPGTGGAGDADGNFKSIYQATDTPSLTKAGGKITFQLYGPDVAGSTTNCNTLAAGFATAYPNGIQVDIQNGGDGTYDTASFTPQSPGVYHWKASYNGDSPNTNQFPASGQYNSGCTDSNEDVTVQQVPTTLTSRQFVFPQDKARIAATAGGNLAGSVAFRLFDTSADCAADDGTATAAGLLYSEAGTAHPISGASPQFATTNNTTFRMNSSTNTSVWWHVVYTSTNPAQVSSDTCSENTAVTFTGDDTAANIPIP